MITSRQTSRDGISKIYLLSQYDPNNQYALQWTHFRVLTSWRTWDLLPKIRSKIALTAVSEKCRSMWAAAFF